MFIPETIRQQLTDQPLIKRECLMNVRLNTTLSDLKKVLHRFDADSIKKKESLLAQLRKESIPANHILLDYHQCLLFLMAYPSSEAFRQAAEQEMVRICQFLKNNPNHSDQFQNTGLAFTPVVSNFSHRLLRWLISEEFDVQLNSFDEDAEFLPKLLRFTLPDLERDLTEVCSNNKELIDLLGLKQEQVLGFLLSEFSRLEQQPLLKDYLFDSMELELRIMPRNSEQSLGFNRLTVDSHYYHTEILKDFDFRGLLDEALPEPEFLSLDMKAQIPAVARLKLYFMQRETDPVSYMDPESIRYYVLERGIAIAFYTMTPDRQLPLESYVGYTLFKNGYPAAYGGSWIFGRRALFGIHIFEWFRGGESGYILGQLLRAYRQVFGIDYFEIEPYQYGLGNPEGIASGAFWFYYKYGFRPVESSIEKLAASEFNKITKTKAYKTSASTLEKFTECNMALQLGESVPIPLWEIREQVSRYINEQYDGNRYRAERGCIQSFLQKTGFRKPMELEFRKVLADVAMVYEAMNWSDPEKVFHLKEMILKKPKDVYRYQDEVLKLLG